MMALSQPKSLTIAAIEAFLVQGLRRYARLKPKQTYNNRSEVYILGRGRNGLQHNSCGRPIKLILTGRVERGIFKKPAFGEGSGFGRSLFHFPLNNRDEPLGIRAGLLGCTSIPIERATLYAT